MQERIKLAAVQEAMDKAKAAGKTCFFAMPNDPSGDPSKVDLSVPPPTRAYARFG